MLIWVVVETITGVLIAGFGLITGVHALLFKRDPRASFAWISIAMLLPIVGAMVYWLFGVNRIQTRARRWQARGLFRPSSERVYSQAEARFDSEQPDRAAALSAILRISERVAKRPLLAGNQVSPLHNGEEAYPAMLSAIANARKRIYLCTYIFDTDDAGMQFVEALSAAAARGVDVRVIVDAIGERYARPRVSKVLRRHKGIKLVRFLPPTLTLRGLRINLRNHRKVLIVDSAVGFTGGMNIGQRHMVTAANNPRPTTDMHFRISGPAVYGLEDVFFEDWYFCTGEEPPAHYDDEVSLTSPGKAMCRAISDGPNEDFEVLTWVLVGAISAARERVQIMTPYFLPSRELLAAFNAAVLRGVAVDIVIPEKNNLPFVAWATQDRLGEVMRYGIRVHYQPPPFNHSKLCIVDGFYTLVGSANLDPRSLRLNFEFNLEVFDAELAQTMTTHFDAVLNASKAVTLEELRERTFLIKFRDAVAKLLSPYM